MLLGEYKKEKKNGDNPEQRASFPLRLASELHEELLILLSFGQCPINNSQLTNKELLGLLKIVPR